MSKDKEIGQADDTIGDEEWARIMSDPHENDKILPPCTDDLSGEFNKTANSNTNEVGYGMPPKHSRFKKGTSGNPKGRKKGTRNLKTDVKEVLNGKIEVNENGTTRKVSAQLASLMRLREKALKGDARALDRLLALAGEHNNEDLPRAKASVTAEDDAAIIEHFLSRKAGDANEANNEATTGNDKETDSGNLETNNE